MIKKIALAAMCSALLAGTALAQDARTVISDAQRALGTPQSITYSGSARDVAFQQCGANATALICYGVAAIIFFQTVVSTGMNLSLLPVTGLTLPFISSGGSSLLTLLFGIGLVESVVMRRERTA